MMRGLARVNALVLGQVVLAIAVCLMVWQHATAPLDLSLVDMQTRALRERMTRQLANDVVVVGLDEPFLESMREPVALMHPHLAKFMQAMVIGRPSVVGLDVIFPRQSYRFLAPTDTPDLNYDLILVKALFATVSADGTIRVVEAELMRLVGAVLDCPLPPLLETVDPATLAA